MQKKSRRNRLKRMHLVKEQMKKVCTQVKNNRNQRKKDQELTSKLPI